MSTTYDLEEVEEGEEHREVGGSLAQITGSEIEQQVAVAHRFPRSITGFRKESTALVTMDEDTAGECMYALPRGGKKIEGPSARFAEIIANSWGNCRAGARTMDDDGRFVTAQGFFFDTQKNVAITYEVKRRITDKSGKRFQDDMIGVTANAACSIALRNAILKGVPKAFWKPVYDAARKCAIGDSVTLGERRTQMLGYFAKLGAPQDKVFALLEVAGEADITLDHLAQLKGLATAIKDGDTTVDQAFNTAPPEKKGATKAPPLKTETKVETANPKWAEWARQFAMASDKESAALIRKQIIPDDPDDEAEADRLLAERLAKIEKKGKK